ncbi:MAG TPA: tRNA (adenosine(37)-N6)-threonylcarbamoyltransferase complex transferase subunit TsaD [Alphaproteobacteria bacterium]|nr:tRNA (adenosine(37)-N6)-threonylcarbamoyltransferase complex transferase subunit TsaD [Alphaproteobacteria bacterium]
MLVLGIETSCDETAAAIVDGEGNVLSNEIYSQLTEHSEFGGVVPEIASRAHIIKIETIIEEALLKANKKLSEIDAIAVTSGPGLIGGVIVGLMTAKGIAASLNKPLICINHLEGHALTCRFTDKCEYPFLLLLASGGHCQFLLVESLAKYKLLGETHDDAIGEAFDKVAKMLDLGYPGGPAVEREALKGNENAFNFPKPFVGREGCDFSLSGLKTAVLRELEKTKPEEVKNILPDICASFQRTVAEIILDRSNNAIAEAKKHLPNVNQFVLSGGVAANKYIGGRLKGFLDDRNFKFYCPPLKLCTDNAAMIAYVGVERLKAGMIDNLNVEPKARWGLS